MGSTSWRLRLLLAKVARPSAGDALQFGILCGSGSYIAIPAAFRTALPKANPGDIYVTPALGVTFPFNLLGDIPLASDSYFWKVFRSDDATPYPPH